MAKKGKQMISKNSNEIVGWYTRGGKHIPIYKKKGESSYEAVEREQDKIRSEAEKMFDKGKDEEGHNLMRQYDKLSEQKSGMEDEGLDKKGKGQNTKNAKSAMYIAQLPESKQKEIMKKLVAKGIKGQDLAIAMDSKITDIEDLLK